MERQIKYFFCYCLIPFTLILYFYNVKRQTLLSKDLENVKQQLDDKVSSNVQICVVNAFVVI